MLCFQSNDEEELQVALRYWSRGESGWCENVKLLAEECGRRPHDFATHVNNLAIAYDLSSRCVECGFPADILSRAAYSSLYTNGCLTYHGSHPRQLFCPTCVDKAAEHAHQAIQEAELSKRDMIHSAVYSWLEEDGPDLDDLEFLDAFYLYVVLQAASDPGDSDDFGPCEFFSVPVAATPSATMKVLHHLFLRRVIIPSLDSSVSAFEFNESAVIFFDLNRVKWMFNIRLCVYSLQTLLSVLSARIDAHAAIVRPEDLKALWKLVAISECESELQQCANYYGFKSFKIGEKAGHALEYALEKFSIPQVWSVIWTATKNAAAFIHSEDSSGKWHAMNTIPGNINRFVDHAIQKNWTINARTRKHWMTESSLTSLFFNRFLVGYPEGFRTITSATIREICQEHAIKSSL